MRVAKIAALAVTTGTTFAAVALGGSVAASADPRPAPTAHGQLPPSKPGPTSPDARQHGAKPPALRALAAPCWQSGSWWCNNVSGAPVYAVGELRVVGRMYSNPSWFVCRAEAGWNNNGPHPTRWEWTQADNGAWGWMADRDIYSETNPLPVC